MPTSGQVFVDDKHMEKYGENSRIVRGGRVSARKVQSMLRVCCREIGRTAARCVSFGSEASERGASPEELTWLADNAYVAARERRVLAKELDVGRELPAGTDGRPAVYALAEALLKTGAAGLTARRLSLFLSGADAAFHLTELELALFLPMLRAAAIRELALAAQDVEAVLDGYSGRAPDNEFAAEAALWRGFGLGAEGDRRLLLKAETAEKLHAHTASQMKELFSLLRRVAEREYSDAVSESGCLERTLSRDAVYASSDKPSREYFRRRLCRAARKNSVEEWQMAELLMESAVEGENVCSLIQNEPSLIRSRERFASAFTALSIMLPLALSAAAAVLASPAVLLLAPVPLYEVCSCILMYFFSRRSHEDFVPAVNIEKGIPAESCAVVAVAVLMTDAETVRRHVQLLERYYLANRGAGEKTVYVLLADYPDSRDAESASDAAIFAAGENAIRALNARLGERFAIIWRRRELNSRDRIYMGHERKRGAVLSLVALMCGEESQSLCVGFDSSRLRLPYLFVLDSDTAPTPESIEHAVASMMHPLNRAVIKDGRVVSGYGILQPRVAVELMSANATLFSRIYAGQGGTDPYSASSSDFNQCLFGNTIFTGKGIINAAAMNSLMKGLIPENRVLSHDLLEGSFLRVGFLPSAELTDGFPSSPRSYFKRGSRWIRGDTQLLPWLGRRIRRADGKTAPNPLDIRAKLRICDNLRRALTPPACFIGIFFACVIPCLATAIGGALSLAALASSLLLNSIERIRNFSAKITTRYRSTIYAGFRGGLLLFFSRFLMLPAESWAAVSALLRALWRMLVSHRRMLEWVTASAAEKIKSKGFLSFYFAFIACPIAGAATVLIGMNPLAFTIGVLWLAAPAYASFISVKISRSDPFSDADKAFLRARGEEMWKYFSDYLTVENNFLPPDNFQEEPCGRLAQRTSPTNIGFAAVASVSAALLGFISSDEAAERILRIVASCEQMRKLRGHLFNWYSTRTLEPLTPAVISSADSGNLAACLLTAASYLRSNGRVRLAERAEKLALDMDFSVFYDRSAGRMRIALDSELKPVSGCYDMLASEARLAVFVAIAKGDVPKRVWTRLQRGMSELDGYAGLVSWSGSLFEYLMPNLLTPEYGCSLIAEANRFAVYCQMKSLRARCRAGLWGASESCYAEFDADLNYRYKPHGVSAIGLRAGLDEELVISPYSSYMALFAEPKKALKNIISLTELGRSGRYGLYEAYDFTASRLNEGEHYRAVKTSMAHHLGMSLASVCNALCHGELQKLFISRAETDAYSSLLAERVPVQSVNVVRRRPRRAAVFEPLVNCAYAVSLSADSLAAPRANICANSGISLIAFSDGTSVLNAACGAVRGGLDCALRFGVEIYGLASMPDDGRALSRRTEFTAGLTRFVTHTQSFSAVASCFVASADIAEIREIRIDSRSLKPEDVEIRFSFEPYLTTASERESHPDYQRMLYIAERLGSGVSVLRKSRGSHAAEGVQRCLSAIIKCINIQKYELSASAERRGPRVSRSSARSLFASEPDETFGDVRDCRITLSVRFTVPAGGTGLVRLCIAAAETAAAASDAAERAIATPIAAGGSLYARSASELSFDSAALTEISELLPFAAGRRERLYRGDFRAESRGALWRLGVSGDFPLALLDCRELTGSEAKAVSRAVRLHALLRRCRVESELAIIYADSGDYDRRGFNICYAAAKIAGELQCLGKSGGIHLIDASEKSERDISALYAAASLALPFSRPDEISSARVPRLAGIASPYLRERAWSQPLTNPLFGCLAADFGFSLTWFRNSRLNKLTAWDNDPFSTRSAGEAIELFDGEKRVSVFCADDGFDTAFECGEGICVWKKRIGPLLVRTTAAVHPKLPLRVAVVELEGLQSDSAVLDWLVLPILGEHQRDSAYTAVKAQSGAMTAEALFAQSCLAAAVSPAPEELCVSEAGYESGIFSGETGRAAIGMRSRAPAKNGRACFVLCLSSGASSADAAALASLFCAREKAEAVFALASGERLRLQNLIHVSTECEPINEYINRWAVWQIVGCRLWMRSSLYQNGGAYGFRDQLQDAASLLTVDSRLLLAQLFRAASHQFEEGDAAHWWHTGTPERGVRTRCSDDLLWLPWAAAKYVGATGDASVLNRKAAYLHEAELSADETERFTELKRSELRESLYAHCVRAIDKFLARGRGAHGLPLILGGDWNDGLSRLGENGAGESVWLAFFASLTLKYFAETAALFGDASAAERFRAESASLRNAGFNAYSERGGFFLRAYSDSGEPLDVVDSVSQSFAAFCADYSVEDERIKVNSALDTCLNRLVDAEHGVLKLLDPPFSYPSEAGYIGAYPRGVRENGGQYTHAAVWLAMAYFAAGRADDGLRLLKMLLPSSHDQSAYRAEDFVLAADVYSGYGRDGVGGWSWYTGSAGWYMQAVLGSMLGIRRVNGRLEINPSLPSGWGECFCRLRIDGEEHLLSIK